MRKLALLTALLALAVAASPQAGLAQAAPESGVRAEALRNFNDAADKAVRLAERMPAESYTWRPGPGVRSVAEVYLHMASGNFSLARRLGAALPEGIQLGPDFERQTTEKAKVVELLKRSVDHVRKAIAAVADADVEKTAPWFGGRQATLREIMFYIAAHNHEHLGQSIAYARMNNIVPPWTEERQQQAPPKKAN